MSETPYSLEQEGIEPDAVPFWEDEVIRKVLKDYERAKKYVEPYHRECLERYEHYRASQSGQNMSDKGARKFPDPFTTEQVDTFRSLMMDKLFRQGKPCTIYGREKTDKRDAEAKQSMFDYLDEVDEIERKFRVSLNQGAIYGIMPCKVDYKEEITTEIQEVQMPVTDNEGVMLMNGMEPLMIPQPVPVEVIQYKGASVEPIDIFSLYFPPEKVDCGDGVPIMVGVKKPKRFFDDNPYFFNQNRIKKKEGIESGTSEETDMIAERRRITGLDVGQSFHGDDCTYIEWQGYYEPPEGIEVPGGEEMKSGHYVIGVVTGAAYEDVLVRFDFDPLKIGKENIIIGVISEDFGSIIGESLLDKFHAIQHGLDTLLGIWIANLKQLVKRPKIVNSDAIKFAWQINNDIDGVIEVESGEDVGKVVKFIEPPNISQDVYAGREMFREMGQNATRIKEQSSGSADPGVDTLGEANIVQNNINYGMNEYLKCIEASFVKPLYKMRNEINKYFLDLEFVIRVIGEKGLYWQTIKPEQVRADVDFICEASSREMQRGVVAQQIIQSMGPTMQLAQMYATLGYAPELWPRPDILMKKLLEQWTWSEDAIEEIFPSTRLGQDETPFPANNPMMMGGQGGQGQGGQGPQPRNEQEAEQSAQNKNQTQVGRV